MSEWSSIAFEGGAGWERLGNAKGGSRGWRSGGKEEEEEEEDARKAETR